MKIYVVKQGDSVDSIAESQGIPVETLVWANQIEYPLPPGRWPGLFISLTGRSGRDEGPCFPAVMHIPL